jgi:dynein heavy chain
MCLHREQAFWMTTMETIAEGLTPDNVHAKFRMWCTTYPSETFPVSILQNGVKMTQEPPRGMRANMIGSFNADPISDPDFYDGVVSADKAEAFHRLVYCLCFFHALTQERRQFGPLGWNIPYEFNESDLRISVQQLAQFVESNEEAPFKALRYTVGECNYGGRVTDDKDRRTLHCILNNCYRTSNLGGGTKLSDSGLFVTPEDTDHADMLRFCDKLPLVAAPEVFGMHENANITKDQNETTALFTNILVTQSSTGGGGGEDGGMSKEETMDFVAADILGKTQDPFDMEQALIRYPVRWDESMNTVLSNELTRFNALISLVKSSLVEVGKAVKGLVVMSAELEALGNALFFGVIPAMWKGKSYPSLKPLAGYCNDLYARLAFADDWLQTTPPSVFWIGGFFFPQAFLTGASQNFARRYTVPIDQVMFANENMPRDEYTNKPKDGVYTRGLFMEAFRWDKKTKLLYDSEPKVLFTTAPLIWFKPIDRADNAEYPCYECPVYKTSDRRGILSTTGHSTNFVCFIKWVHSQLAAMPPAATVLLLLLLLLLLTLPPATHRHLSVCRVTRTPATGH